MQDRAVLFTVMQSYPLPLHNVSKLVFLTNV